MLKVLDQLRLKLLDLTGRNRLINFKHTAGKSLPFVEGQPADIYQRLVESNNKSSISICGLPEADREYWTERNGRLQRPDPVEWATSHGIPTSYGLPPNSGLGTEFNVRALMYPDDLAKHCRKIEREAISAIEETGANMLYLVLGFLDLPEQLDSDKIFSAPLVSIPVTLFRKESGGIQVFFLQFTGDNISENLSLREKLKNDFGLILPELDEEQIDVEQYLNKIHEIVKQKPRFAVRRRVSLCLLSFTNILLYRDLDSTNWPQQGEQNDLLDHPIVREVLEGSSDETDSVSGLSDEYIVEEEPGASIPLVYDADSSQHSALIDVLINRRNLVIEGPPGTGKSQTITNLIAASLAEGKKILFVAEKMAALEVVKNRLTMAGLDPFLLELHSNKTSKKRVLDEIGKRINFKSNPPADLNHLLLQLESHRNELKTYADLINSVVHNSFGQTLHQIMWTADKHRGSLRNKGLQLVPIKIVDAPEISKIELSRRMECLSHLSDGFKSIGGLSPDSAFWGFYPDQIIPGDETQIVEVFSNSKQWVAKLIRDVKVLSDLLGTQVSGLTLESLQSQIALLDQLLSKNRADLPLHLVSACFERDRSGENATQVLSEFRNRIQRFSALQKVVNTAIRNEESVTKAKFEELKRLCAAGERVGVKLGTPRDLKSSQEKVTLATESLVSSIESINEFAKNKNIPFDGQRTSLNLLEILADLVINIPMEYMHLQSQALNREGALHAIEKLSILQDQWLSIFKELDTSLYLDALPPEELIKKAIQTFREGDAWYRLFQTRWREARSLHKSLQRTKTKIPNETRLAELDKIVKFIEVKKKWNSDAAWIQYLGITAPADAINLNKYAVLAKWNHDIRMILEEANTNVIDAQHLTQEQARLQRRDFIYLKNQLDTAKRGFLDIETELTRLKELPEIHIIAKLISHARSFLREIEPLLDWALSEAQSQATFADLLRGCEATLERKDIKKHAEQNIEAKRLLPGLFKGINTHVDDVAVTLEALSFGLEIDRTNLPKHTRDYILYNHPIAAMVELKNSLTEVTVDLYAVREFESQLKAKGEFDLIKWVGLNPEENLLGFAEKLNARIFLVEQSTAQLIPWSLYVARRKDAHELGLSDFVNLVESKRLEPVELADFYAFSSYSTVIREAFRNIPELGRFTGLKHNQIREEFKRLDREIIHLRGRFIAQQCLYKAKPPGGRNGVKVNDKTQMTLLNHLLPQQRPRMPLRKMFLKAGRAIECLKPCFMMGPQAVAQYLTPGAISFDLVIMDEASQLKPEEAIGAIARGGQLVVVGDAKQLPPTTFFMSRFGQKNDDDEQYTTTDTESILDVCSSQFRTKRPLRWHYRSQHHSLIAFSNHSFYEDNLIVFPSPYGQGGRLGIKATYLADAIYENQTNIREAKRVVDAVIDHIINRADDSVGVVTLNIKQRDLIAELFEDRIKSNIKAANYKEHWEANGQPIFFKNLENVQGDERDSIIISTTFGRSVDSNVVRQNFGPISRQGGWRRLNVLFTRAKKSISIFTSLRPEDIVIDATTPLGTKTLRNYLEYARTGLLTFSEETYLEPDSDFEVSVIKVLRTHGYEVTPQLGVGGYRIDIAVKHPDAPGTYLAAIECDGASYHSALSVRDRDRIRQEILESLGWKDRIWRIWSTDWFRTPRQEIEKLIGFIENLRKTWKPEYSSGESWTEEGQMNLVMGEKEFDASQAILDRPEVVNKLNEEERKEVSAVIIETDEDIEIGVGDSVSYIDTLQPENVLMVQITQNRTDPDQGLISEQSPLAQILLGGVVGDEVTLHQPNMPSRKFQITEIKRK